jgi:D-glycero-alpha-D-manno-heptose 1-phosphate guanylyltransferase
VLNCLPECSEWILVANGDGICVQGIEELLALRQIAGVSGGLLGVNVDDTSRYGSLEHKGFRLTAFKEKVPGRGLINSGLYLFRKSILSEMGIPRPCSIERELIPQLLAAGHDLRVVAVSDAPFIDIGTPETLVEAEAFVRRNLQP